MHRVAVVAMVAALLGVPSPGVAYQPDRMIASVADLRPQLMLRIFGEVSDAGASAAAAFGDPESESPLRGLALIETLQHRATRTLAEESVASQFQAVTAQSFGNAPVDATAAFAIVGSAAPSSSANLTPSANSAAYSPPASFTMGQYEPVTPLATISPQPGSVSFGPSLGGNASGDSPPTIGFGDQAAPLRAGRVLVSAPTTVRVGPLKVATRFEGTMVQSQQPSLLDNGYGAGANFDLRAGRRNLNVDVTSGYEHLTSNGTAAYAPAFSSNAPSLQLPSGGAPIVPNYAELSRISIGAAVSVPVVSGLTLNLNYGAGRLFGGYGLSPTTTFGGTDNSYGGKLTFDMPHSANTLTISARALHYQDGLVPTDTRNQTGGDVNFTVKF